jgi:hypothetical protein
MIDGTRFTASASRMRIRSARASKDGQFVPMRSPLDGEFRRNFRSIIRGVIVQASLNALICGQPMLRLAGY